MVAIMIDATSTTYMKHLCTYLRDDAKVANYTNVQFGTRFTAKHVTRLRSTLPMRKQS